MKNFYFNLLAIRVYRYSDPRRLFISIDTPLLGICFKWNMRMMDTTRFGSDINLGLIQRFWIEEGGYIYKWRFRKELA